MINSFTGPNRWLSNFFMSEVRMPDGITYPSAEHAYQAYKTTDRATRILMAEQVTPGQAKRLGRQIKIRDNWDKIKITVMTLVVLEKFKQDSVLQHALIATGNQMLEEGNWWRDTFWGVCEGKGENNLGKILMKVRTILREKGYKL